VSSAPAGLRRLSFVVTFPELTEIIAHARFEYTKHAIRGSEHSSLLWHRTGLFPLPELLGRQVETGRPARRSSVR
jgi:hypothetical protein